MLTAAALNYHTLIMLWHVSSLEMEAKVREVFTITEKAPARDLTQLVDMK